MIYDNILELIGKTPLLKLNKIKEKLHLVANLYVKLEKNNLTSSVKDRIAKRIVLDLIKNDKVKKNSTLVIATSGNTGISLASICAFLDLHLIVTMPSNMSIERVKILEALGAEVISTPAQEGMTGAINKANEVIITNPNYHLINQFTNENNYLAHYYTTGREIYDDTDGNVDVVICGIGSGGTISGIGKYLKEKNPHIKIIGVEPRSSSIITTGKSGKHKIPGLGAGFIPQTYLAEYVDEILTVSDDEALFFQNYVQRKEGILMGISSGAALSAAIHVASNEQMKDKNIVVILPDSLERYLGDHE